MKSARSIDINHALTDSMRIELIKLIKISDRMAYDGDWSYNSVAVNEKVLELDKYYIKSYLRIAQSYERRNDEAELNKIYNRLLIVDPSNVKAQNWIRRYELKIAKKDKPSLSKENKENCLGLQIINYHYLNRNKDSEINLNNQAKYNYNRDIKDYLLSRNVYNVFHFTNIDNLNSISERGILPRDRLEQLGINAKITDNTRREGHEDCICLSISHPNTSMMWNKIYNLHYTFAILELNPKILFETENVKYFFPSNSVRFRNNNTDYSNPFYLKQMFGYNEIRNKLSTYDFYTTDPQAEVLYKGVIDKKYIRRIYIKPCDKQKALFGKEFIDNSIVYDDLYFNHRGDHEFWKEQYYDGKKIFRSK